MNILRPMNRNKRLLLTSSALLLAAASPAVLAEPGNPLNDRFFFAVGGFLLDTDTEIRVDGDVPGSGSEIDMQRDLGLQDADRVRVDAYWRMTPRQKLRFTWFDTNADGSRVLEDEIEFNDTIYEVNLEVRGEIETTITALSYEYDFWQTDKAELGGTFGIHNIGFDVGLSATLNGVSGQRRSSASADGPMPLIGLHGIYRFNEKFYLDYGLQYFQISFDEYDGSITDATVSVVWQFSKHVGAGAGWNQFRTNLEVDGERFDGELTWKYGGARIFLTASF